jgi:Zn ribbon nucleic-acid-binding protein
MRLKQVECLNCGAVRRAALSPSRPGNADECVRCGYVGWAETETLTETLRRSLREYTLEQRRHLIAW